MSVLVAMPAAAIQAQSDTSPLGFRGPNYESSGFASPTAEKAESKVWWHDGYWWADLYQNEAKAHHIYRLDPATMQWIDTGTALDDRKKSRSDILWDGATGKLYVASHLSGQVSEYGDPGDQGLLYRYSYDPSAASYTLDPGFPVAITPGRTQTLTLAKDSTGRLWIAYVWNRMVTITHSLDDEFHWSSPYPLPVSGAITSQEDIAVILAFGGDKIGVAWSDQDDNRLDFAFREDGAPIEEWHEEIIGLGNSLADNHLNAAAGTDGKVYLVSKTSLKRKDEPMTMLHVRDTQGIWSSHVVAMGSDDHTRPIVVVDDERARVYVLATSPTGGGSIYLKTSAVDPIAFEPGRGARVLDYVGAKDLNDVTSTKQAVNRATGILILASDRSSKYYYYNLLDLGE